MPDAAGCLERRAATSFWPAHEEQALSKQIMSLHTMANVNWHLSGADVCTSLMLKNPQYLDIDSGNVAMRQLAVSYICRLDFSNLHLREHLLVSVNRTLHEFDEGK